VAYIAPIQKVMGVMTHDFLLALMRRIELVATLQFYTYCTSTCNIRLAMKLPKALINN